MDDLVLQARVADLVNLLSLYLFIGFVLGAIVAGCAVYLIFSPATSDATAPPVDDSGAIEGALRLQQDIDLLDKERM